MKLASTRELSELKHVLKDMESEGPDPVYWVFGEVSQDKWANITITVPGKIGEEFPKTFGHYHSSQVNETFHVISGEVIIILQKKHYERGEWVPEMVDEVLLVRCKPGEEITVTPEYGHSTTNPGKEPLIAYDNWRSGHQPSDYEPIKKLQGMAYYLVEESGEVKAVPNPNYKNLPIPIWATPMELSFKE